MINFSTKSPSQKCIKCNFPPCNCSKCTLLRSEDKPDQQTNNPCAKVTCEDEYGGRNKSEASDNLELDPEAEQGELKESTEHRPEENTESEDIIEQMNENSKAAEAEKEEVSKDSPKEAGAEAEKNKEEISKEISKQAEAEAEKNKEEISKESPKEAERENISKENPKEAELEEKKEELSSKNLEDTESPQEKEELSNDIPKEPAQPEGDTIEQTEESLMEVNASEAAITYSEKIAGKFKQFGIRRIFGVSSLTFPSFNFKPDNLQSVLFDMVGIIAFFAMTTVMFWVTIAQYCWHFLNIILSSGKKTQIVASVLFLLLCASITFHAIQGRNHLREKQQKTQSTTNESPGSPTVQQPTKNPKYCDFKRRSQHNLKTSTSKSQNSNENILAPQDSCLCMLCGKTFKGTPGSIMSDEEALEMFKRYKLYSVPTEMKTPPSIVHTVEILTGFFNRITNTIANTFNAATQANSE